MEEIKAKIVARTFEVTDECSPITSGSMIKDFNILSGKAAGVCYMPDDYLSEGIQNIDSAIKRADNTAKNGHISVFEHCYITMVLELNKALAMVLNSLGVYTTSEKSARYTKFIPQTDKELNLYNKWLDIIQRKILDEYPWIDDEALSKKLCKIMGVKYTKVVYNGSISQLKDDEWLEEEFTKIKKDITLPSYKLAQENARYMISVFTPTVMEYTVSYRQLSNICDLFDTFLKSHDKTEFSNRLKPYVEKLNNEFKEILKLDEETLTHFKSNKNQHLRFIESSTVSSLDPLVVENITSKKESIGDSYTISYKGSLAMLAQAQRHRTIRYSMFLDKATEFYVPAIISKNGLEKEWLEDLKEISDVFPQATLVRITEQGIFEDFALKCKERLCGRAQLEIMKQTIESLNKFVKNGFNLNCTNRLLLVNMLDRKNDMCAVPRCCFSDYECNETCQWGGKQAFTRLV